tara:strand:- start:12176 stop:12613 length:438 start_codon:yes stop_codon:yes gene_type:complete
MKNEDNPWWYKFQELNEETVEGYVGFVYKITNLETKRKYIGKKILKFTRRKSIKGQKRRKKVVLDSDWREYYGSNKELKQDVETLGPEKFIREVLKLCKSKSEMSYWEAHFQFKYDVLLSDDYYNSWISCKIHKSNLRLTLDIEE